MAVEIGSVGDGGSDRAALAPPRRPRALRAGLWANRDFLHLWAGETVSLFGSRVTTLALPLTAVLTLHATAGQLGLLRAIEFIPFVFLTLLAGVWIDRRRKRPVMIAANVGRAALVGLVPVLAMAGALRMGHLYLVALGLGILTVSFDLSWLAYVPAVVGREHLVEANSKLMASFSAAEVGGPGLAGILVQVLTAPIALVVDAVSYLVSVTNLTRIRRPEPPASAASEPVHLIHDVRDGFRTVFGNPFIRAIAFEGLLFNLFYQFIEIVFVVYAIRELGFGAGLLGLVIAVGSAGSLVGAAGTARLVRRFGFGLTLTSAMVVACVAPIVVPLVRAGIALEVAAFGATFFVVGIGEGISNVLSISLRQSVTPDHLLARMNASMRMALYGGIPAGGLIAGALAGTIGARGALWIAAVGFLVALIPVFVSPIPRTRELPVPSGSAPS